MKDYKNFKVFSEGLSWMIIVLDDFGIGYVLFKVVLVACVLICI